MRRAALKTESIDAGTIGFVIGPRLNAAGRMESALRAYELLVTQYPPEADQLAIQLDNTNRERQNLTLQMTNKARDAVASIADSQHLLFVAAPDFPEGIVGLIASRLAEEFYRPAVAVHQGEDESRGSARSISEFNIVAALDECRDLLVRHGGHAMAAGFTVRNENLLILQNRLREIAEQKLADSELVPTINVDALAPLAEMNQKLADMLSKFAPFGYGNREPIFASRNVVVRDARIVGTDHLKLMVSDGQIVMDAIAFRQGSWLDRLPPRIDVAYQLEAQVWNGRMRLQLNVKDIQPANAA
jgi:single-stranded-DNA-specific exonuclease